MKYNLFKAINANVLYEYKGSYKKKGYQQAFSNFKKTSSEIGEAYPTEWNYQSFEITNNSFSTALILPSQIFPINHHYQRSYLQEHNQIQKKDSNVAEDTDKLKDKDLKIAKPRNFLNKITKLFSLKKEIFINGVKNCNDEFDFLRLKNF